jgi:hypothetical protein
MIETFTIQMIFAGIMILLCALFLLIDIYLALGWISPHLSIRIDQRIRKLLRKPPVIILDPWYIRKRNAKWFVLIVVLFQVVLVLGGLMIELIE